MSDGTVDIPITAARQIAKRYGYDQIVIIGRAIGEGGREHVTTYGVDRDNCEVAARIGNFFKHRLMGWPIDNSRGPISEEARLAMVAGQRRRRAREAANG